MSAQCSIIFVGFGINILWWNIRLLALAITNIFTFLFHLAQEGRLSIVDTQNKNEIEKKKQRQKK